MHLIYDFFKNLKNSIGPEFDSIGSFPKKAKF